MHERQSGIVSLVLLLLRQILARVHVCGVLCFGAVCMTACGWMFSCVVCAVRSASSSSPFLLFVFDTVPLGYKLGVRACVLCRRHAGCVTIWSPPVHFWEQWPAYQQSILALPATATLRKPSTLNTAAELGHRRAMWYMQ